MDIHIVNKEGRPRTRDISRRAWSMPVEGAPAVYRNRIWPYKGRRTFVKSYGPAEPSKVEVQVK